MRAACGCQTFVVRHPMPLPAALHGRAFFTVEAREASVTRSRTRAQDLFSPYRGVRMLANAKRNSRELFLAYATRMPREQFFSHTTAAVLHGLPLPWRLQQDDRVHVGVVGSVGAARMRGVTSHRLTHATIDHVCGMRVMSPTETWRHLAGVLDFESLVVMGDALVRPAHPLSTVSELAIAVREHHGCRGARLLRDALESVRPGVDSPRETLIRLIIVKAGLPEPVVNCKIFNRYGAFIALGDMVYAKFRILIEYDGGHHFESIQQAHHDIDRLDEVMEERWRVIRLNSSHLRHRTTVVQKVRTALEDAGWRS